MTFIAYYAHNEGWNFWKSHYRYYGSYFMVSNCFYKCKYTQKRLRKLFYNNWNVRFIELSAKAFWFACVGTLRLTTFDSRFALKSTSIFFYIKGSYYILYDKTFTMDYHDYNKICRLTIQIQYLFCSTLRYPNSAELFRFILNICLFLEHGL